MPRGRCKKHFHCTMDDFDGDLLKEYTARAKAGLWQRDFSVRQRSDYRDQGDHKNIPYDYKTGVELVAGVETTIPSYITWKAKAEKKGFDEIGSCGVVTFAIAESASKAHVSCTEESHKGLKVEIAVGVAHSSGNGKTTRITLIKGNQRTVAKELDNKDDNVKWCSHVMAESVWARVDSFGEVSVGAGDAVGKEKWGSFQIPRDKSAHNDGVFWTTCVGIGAMESAITYQNIEVNRGDKTEVYCDWTNPAKPHEATYKITGKCFRKQPDTYPEKYGIVLRTDNTNAGGTRKLSCKQMDRDRTGVSLDADPTACRSGICKDWGVVDLRCAGCATDNDCSIRTYAGSDCSIGTPAVAKISTGKYAHGKIGPFNFQSTKFSFTSTSTGKSEEVAAKDLWTAPADASASASGQRRQRICAC